MVPLPVSKVVSPELGSIALRYPELIPCERSEREKRLQFAEHVTKNQTQFREVSPVMGRFVEHLFLAFFEQFDGLFAFPHQIDDENVEMFVVV